MVMMSATGRTLCCLLLLWTRTSAQAAELRCSSAGPVGALHPVQGLLETFEAGPGCAARERGDKETHVVSVRRSTNSPENKVTVLLKPLSLSPSPVRTLHLLLSSKLPVSWWLEAETLPPDLPVHVQVSSNSSVQSHALHLLVHVVHPLPFRPAALHRWALTHHGNLSSLTHTTHGNRVYIRLGEDPTLPPVCQLQSTFLSPNYLTSDLQPQEVQGCSQPPAAGINPAVHVIKLHSAGSGLCGSLQVEVVVSLVPPVANTRAQDIVLVLSSSVPVHWAITARGVRGHISVHSSNSVSPPFPPEPDLTLSSTLTSDLSTVSDLLVWANESGYTHVTSYTEADLANRFVVQLAGGGTDVLAGRPPLAVRPPWAEERRLRQWLNGGDGAGGRESFTVQCEDGRLSVTVDRRILQTLSVPVAAVTLQDPTCQAQSNGSHFLLVFPVISCGTEGLFLGRPRGVQYTNMMILWRDQPQTLVALNDTERKSKGPLGIHFSCLAAGPSVAGPAGVGVEEVNTPQAGLVHWAPGEPAGPDPARGHLPVPRHRPGPVLILRLFVTEVNDQKRIGPCVVTAGHRVYVEISAEGPLPDAVEVKSCIISPLSDPKKSPFWTIIREGCSSDPSLTLSAEAADEEEEEEEEEEGDAGELEERRRREAPGRWEESGSDLGSEEETRPLRFSFILRPVHNDSIQFLHCSLNMCSSDSTRGEAVKEPAERACQDGLPIPALVSKSHKHQCEIRTLSRPMVVTQSISSLVPKQLRPPAGPRTKRLSVSPVASPGPQDRNSVVQTGPVMGVVFAAFVMGVSLMGGLWCIYNYTAKGPTSLGGEGLLIDQTPGGHNTWNPPLLSDQSSSSV
ncbi:transforming growth factor beta receptor type 3 [Pleuronectes platessa]|uniref:transforming growth factor beta receptor type 3 n=1 Tax=Pleuronectes platessa TaxID=8262 RepID=UPI00232A19A4|nr:transforming growth factor beta receptor type 3 [Pleuronectes platessa]